MSRTICEECKRCWNYMVCENGCYGSTEPCEHWEGKYEPNFIASRFIEELEKIKDEIQGLIDFEESCCGNTTLGYECLSVINNKISELKGENR